LEGQNPEFRILALQNLEFRRILALQNLEFRRILALQNLEFKILQL